LRCSLAGSLFAEHAMQRSMIIKAYS